MEKDVSLKQVYYIIYYIIILYAFFELQLVGHVNLHYDHF